MESIIEQTYTKATKCAINLGINRVTLTLGKILVVLIYRQVLKLIVNMLVMSYFCFSHCLSFFFIRFEDYCHCSRFVPRCTRTRPFCCSSCRLQVSKVYIKSVFGICITTEMEWPPLYDSRIQRCAYYDPIKDNFSKQNW